MVRWAREPHRVVVIARRAVLRRLQRPSSPAPSGTTDAGFPLGSFSKEVDDPDGGRMRIVWTFGADGRFTEVPIALDGQRLDPSRSAARSRPMARPSRSRRPSRRAWARARTAGGVDGDRLWTFLVESDNPEDKDWFEGLDSRPWEPYQS